MKKVISFLVSFYFIIGFVYVVNAADVTLKWDNVPQPDLAGYTLYQRIEGEAYDFNTPTYVINDLHTDTITINVEDGTYFWVLKAFDDYKRYSDASNEVSVKIDSINWPKAPQGFIIFKIEATASP